jgi:hypothetical protein
MVNCRLTHVCPDGPAPFAVAPRAAKAALDPAGVLHPGVLVDPV